MENNSLQHDDLTGSGTSFESFTSFVPLCSNSHTETSGRYEKKWYYLI